MHFTTKNVSNSLYTIECKGVRGLQVFVGLDSLNDIQLSEFHIQLIKF